MIRKLIRVVPLIVAIVLAFPVLPVRAQASTFGYTTAGASQYSIEANSFAGSVFTLSEAGTITSITANVRAWSAGYHFKAVLTSHADPSAILAIGDAQSLSSSGYTWVTSTFGTPYVAAAGDYILGIVNEVYAGIHYDAGDANQTHSEADNNYGSPTAPSGFTHSNEKLSIYATYTPSASGDDITTGALTLTATMKSISVYANYSDDDNDSATALVEYRQAGGMATNDKYISSDDTTDVVTTDGTYVYVGVDDSGTVRVYKIDTSDMSVNDTWDSGSANSNSVTSLAYGGGYIYAGSPGTVAGGEWILRMENRPCHNDNKRVSLVER